MKVYNQIPTWWKQPAFNRFKELYKEEDKPLLFIGSGLSLWAKLPTWRVLLEELARRHDSSSGHEHILPEVLQLLSSDPPEYQKAGAVVKEAYQKLSGNALRSQLRSILDKEEFKEKESRVHKALINLKWNRIITTNYDALIECAINRAGREIEVCHPKSENMLEIERSGYPFLFKIHGDIRDQDSDLILAEEDYERLYAPNSDDLDSTDSKPDFHQTLTTLLRHWSPILFIGFSHDDEYFRRLYRFAIRGLERRKNIFGLVTRQERLEDFESKLKTRSNMLHIDFITYSSDKGHEELLEFLEYLPRMEELDAKYCRMDTVRRPTAVMLYCGGTIGAKHQEQDGKDLPLENKLYESRFDPELEEFSDKLLKWYRDTYNLGNDFELDIKWETLPKQEQMFSEHATPDYWTTIARKVEEVAFKYFQAPSLVGPDTLFSDKRLRALYNDEDAQYKLMQGDGPGLSEKAFLAEFTNRYILGIILLHGTDTLAYTASALSFGLQNLPCPLVLTGSNQPPDIERIQFISTSDAWKNLIAALYFLQSFGHRLTESLVCFGETIHHGVNLRKTSLDLVPFCGDSIARREYEPFGFRNYSFQSQYMFRLIDGVFCDNYYTKSPSSPTYTLLANYLEEFQDLRHLRLMVLPESWPQETKVEEFSSVVRFVRVTPNFPDINVEAMVSVDSPQRPLRAVLVEGYSSATLPTDSRNPFAKFLADLQRHSIPVLLISRYGIAPNQLEYKTPNPIGDSIRVRRLYGVIGETALPLLSLVINNIPDKEWPSEAATHDQLVNDRIRIIDSALNKLVGRKNIISEALKGITEKSKLRDRIVKYEERGKRADALRKERYKSRHDFEKPKWVEHPSKWYITMSRGDFHLLLDEFVAPFEKAGAGPDALAILNDIGFEFGFQAAGKYTPSNIGAAGYNPYFSRKKAEQDELLQAANTMLQETSKLMNDTGIARIQVEGISINHDTAQSDSNGRRYFSFSTRVNRSLDRWGGGGAGKYNVTSFSGEERLFFTRLRLGCGDGVKAGQHFAELSETYDDLHLDTWHHTTCLDWLLLGVFKGVACKLAQLLRFNKRAVSALREDSPGQLQALRNAIRTHILAGDNNIFEVKFFYED